MPFLLAEILNYQGSAHLIGVGSLSKIDIKHGRGSVRPLFLIMIYEIPVV